MGQVTIALTATGPILAGLIWAICLLIRDKRQDRRQLRAAIDTAKAARARPQYSEPSESSSRVTVPDLLRRAIDQREPLRLNWHPDQIDDVGRVRSDAEDQFPTEVLPAIKSHISRRRNNYTDG